MQPLRGVRVLDFSTLLLDFFKFLKFHVFPPFHLWNFGLIVGFDSASLARHRSTNFRPELLELAVGRTGNLVHVDDLEIERIAILLDQEVAKRALFLLSQRPWHHQPDLDVVKRLLDHLKLPERCDLLESADARLRKPLLSGGKHQ